MERRPANKETMRKDEPDINGLEEKANDLSARAAAICARVDGLAVYELRADAAIARSRALRAENEVKWMRARAGDRGVAADPASAIQLERFMNQTSEALSALESLLKECIRARATSERNGG